MCSMLHMAGQNIVDPVAVTQPRSLQRHVAPDGQRGHVFPQISTGGTSTNHFGDSYHQTVHYHHYHYYTLPHLSELQSRCGPNLRLVHNITSETSCSVDSLFSKTGFSNAKLPVLTLTDPPPRSVPLEHRRYSSNVVQIPAPSQTSSRRSTVANVQHYTTSEAPTTDGSGKWVSILEIPLSRAFVKIEDAGNDGESTENTFLGCRVAIQAVGKDLITNSRRRLVLSQGNHDPLARHLFWLPSTRMNVARMDSILQLQFSNCKQLFNNTRDHTNNYEAVYSPDTPNVYMRLECEKEEQAHNLYSRLLHLTGSSAPDERSEVVFPDYCTIRRDSVTDVDGQVLGSGLYIWRHVQFQDSGIMCSALDLGCFTSKLDFEVEVVEQTLLIHLRHFMKIKYSPLNLGKSPYWPPPKVEENHEGAPGCMEIGHDSLDDTLIMTCPITQARELFDNAIGFAPDVSTKAWLSVEYVINPRRIGRNRSKTGHLTLVERKDSLYGLLRQVNSSETEDDSQSAQQKWRALNWNDKKSSLKSVEATKVTIEGLQSACGDFLSLQTAYLLEPQSSGAEAKSTLWEKTKIELRFKTAEDCAKALNLFRDYDCLDT